MNDYVGLLRVGVTGSSGLIGAALVKRLDADSRYVPVPLDRSPTKESLEGLHAVVHLAGEPIAARRWTAEQKQRIAQSRSVGTRNLSEVIAELDQPPTVLISGSAIGFYGDRGDELLDEKASSGDGFLAQVCRDWEAATAPVADAGVRVCHARTGIVLSPKGGALKSLLLPFKLGIGGRVGDGTQWMSWISLEDEVSALIHLLETDILGPVNLVSNNPVTNTDFTKTLGKVLRRPALLPTPKLALKLRLGSELANELLFSSIRVTPSQLLATNFTFQHQNLDQALQSML